ncbi:hypothetical protein D3C72_395580 [compost metagenome]
MDQLVRDDAVIEEGTGAEPSATDEVGHVHMQLESRSRPAARRADEGRHPAGAVYFVEHDREPVGRRNAADAVPGGDGVPGVFQDLLLQGVQDGLALGVGEGGARQHLDAVEGRGLGRAVDLGEELGDFVLHRLAIADRVGAVGRLHGQLAGALEHRVHGREARFGDLRERDGVLDVAGGLLAAAHLGAQRLRDAEARGVVRGAVDAQPRAQALQARRQVPVVLAGLTPGVEGADVGVDPQGCTSMCDRTQGNAAPHPWDATKRVGTAWPLPIYRRLSCDT